MAKHKMVIGIVLIIGLLLVIILSESVNFDSNKPETKITTEVNAEEDTTEIVATDVEKIPSPVVNVIDFGAKGDGVTDDSSAFQEALDRASEDNITLLIPKSSQPYLILTPLELKSNTHITGYNATLFMPSNRQVQNIFSASSRREISNITIEGLTLLSENDQKGTGEYEGSFTSNIQGIFIFGINQMVLQDVTMENMYIGIKLDASKNGDKSKNIKIDNLKIYNSRTPLFMTSTSNFIMTNSILDASGGATKFLHAAYIRGDTSDLEFDGVQFINSPGGGIHIYNSNDNLSPPENIRIKNCTIENSKVGLYLYSGANDINISNIIMRNIELPFKINSASNVNISGIDIGNSSEVIHPVGLFSMDKMTDSIISNITVDAKGTSGYVFDIGSGVSDLTVSEMKVTNLYDVGLVYSNADPFQDLVIKNSSFEWMSVKGALLRFNSMSSTGSISDNQFINRGNKAKMTLFNTTNTGVILENNEYAGF